MKNKSMFWRVTALGFVVVNVGGLIYAAMMGESRHAIVHLGVLAAGLLAWQFIPGREEVAPIVESSVDEKVLGSLQESIDAIALNVERIGEDQRFQAKLVKERTEKSPGETEER